MKDLLAKIDRALAKPMSNGSSTSVATVVVLGLTAVVVSVYMGWIKLKKRGW